MKCKKCGHANKQGAKFCDTCGTSMVGGFCPECGHKNQAAAQFCEECGANFKGAVKKSGLPKETSKKPGLSPVLKIAVGGIGLIIFVGGAFRMLQYSNFSLPNFLSGAESSSGEESKIAKVAYTTNPETIVEEDTPITMVFDWLANTKEQVQDFIDNAEQEVMINGTPAIVKTTYSVISSDKDTGGFKTQVTAEIGKLPVGINTITTTISWKQQITNGKQSFGPGTDNEKVKKEAKIVVSSPSNLQKAGGDSAKADQGGDISNCPPETDITIGEATYVEETDNYVGYVYLEIRNKHGWDQNADESMLPAYFFREKGGVGGALVLEECYVDPDDDTLIICVNEGDQKPSVMELHLPYPWSASPVGYCVVEDLNIPVVDQLVEINSQLPGGCCQITDVSNIEYQGIPTVSRYLNFDLECDDSWPVSSDGCFSGETFIGENQDIRWAEVLCCLDSSSDDLLHCESERSVEQKVSWTKVKLDGFPGDCKWESPKFYTPDYTKAAPPPSSDSPPAPSHDDHYPD